MIKGNEDKEQKPISADDYYNKAMHCYNHGDPRNKYGKALHYLRMCLCIDPEHELGKQSFAKIDKELHEIISEELRPFVEIGEKVLSKEMTPQDFLEKLATLAVQYNFLNFAETDLRYHLAFAHQHLGNYDIAIKHWECVQAEGHNNELDASKGIRECEHLSKGKE